MTSRRSGVERIDRRRALGLAGSLALAGCARGLAVSGGAAPAAAAEGATIHVDGVPLFYRSFGSGPPVVLIHGASGNLRDWTFRAAPEIARTHTVYAFDRPGHGLSGWPAEGGAQLSVQAGLMRHAMAALGVERARVIGHSYGGSVALAWAVGAPGSVDGLMLIASPSEVWQGGLGWSTEVLANPVAGPLAARAAPYLVSDDFARQAVTQVFAPQEAPAGYFAHLEPELILRPETLRRNALQLAALKEQIRALVPRYPALPMPIEVLHGTADDTVPIDIHSKPFTSQVAQANLTILEGIGHMPHQVALPEVLDAVARLEARVPG